MTRPLALFACAVLMAIGLRAHAAPQQGVLINRFTPTQTGINGVALSTCPNFTIPTQGTTTLVTYVQLAWASATQVTLACQGGPGAAMTGDFVVNNPNGTTGAIPGTTATFYRNVNSSRLIRFNLSPVVDDWVSCTVCGSGMTTDTITVSARAQTP